MPKQETKSLQRLKKDVLDPNLILNDRELSAYHYWQSTQDPPIAPSTQAKMFELFLQGKELEEIRRLNPGFSLGAIAAARLQGGWDQQRDQHLQDLLGKVRGRVQQSFLETVDLFCDLLAAKNKVHRDKVLKFIQSGDERELADLNLGGMKGYKDIIEGLAKLTGQDQNRKVSGSVTLQVETPRANQPMAPADAAAIISALLASNKKKEDAND